MRALYLILCLWFVSGLFCPGANGDIVTAHSSSGQFTAQEIRRFPPRTQSPVAFRTQLQGGWAFLLASPPANTPPKEEVTLDPSLLVLSCERFKQGVLGELKLPDQWQGRIDLIITPALLENDEPVLTAINQPGGWKYDLELPKKLHKQILVRALMETILLEIANRNAGSESAQIPLWLIEGMTAHLEANTLNGLILQPSLEASVVKLQGLDLVREQLRQNKPLSFQRLSWPNDADLSGENLKLYRSCAQLFLEDLLQFKDGKLCLQKMLGELPRRLNWQTAFLEGFHTHFQQLLDVEKWWGLSYVAFTQGDLAQTWPAQDCWKKLQDTLDVPVEVHFASNQMPADAAITLQEAFAQWPAPEVGETLRRTIGDLQFLHYRAPAPLRELIDLYWQTLVDYATANNNWAQRNAAPRPGQTASAIQQLDALDKKRAAWHLQLN